jgi:hypothetical protein
MQWQMPFQNPNAIQEDWLNTDAGQRAIFQNMQDFFLSGNGSPQAKNAFGDAFYPQVAQWQTNQFQNPLQPKSFQDWLFERQGQVAAGYNNLARTARGGRPGFGQRVRDLW